MSTVVSPPIMDDSSLAHIRAGVIVVTGKPQEVVSGAGKMSALLWELLDIGDAQSLALLAKYEVEFWFEGKRVWPLENP